MHDFLIAHPNLHYSSANSELFFQHLATWLESQEKIPEHNELAVACWKYYFTELYNNIDDPTLLISLGVAYYNYPHRLVGFLLSLLQKQVTVQQIRESQLLRYPYYEQLFTYQFQSEEITTFQRLLTLFEICATHTPELNSLWNKTLAPASYKGLPPYHSNSNRTKGQIIKTAAPFETPDSELNMDVNIFQTIRSDRAKELDKSTLHILEYTLTKQDYRTALLILNHFSLDIEFLCKNSTLDANIFGIIFMYAIRLKCDEITAQLQSFSLAQEGITLVLFTAFKLNKNKTLQYIIPPAPSETAYQHRLFYAGSVAKTRLGVYLLQHIVNKNHKDALVLLESNRIPELLLYRGNVTLPSGQTIKSVTAFELTLHIPDCHYMALMLLETLPSNNEGEKIRLSLKNQLEQVIKASHTVRKKTTLFGDARTDKDTGKLTSHILTTEQTDLFALLQQKLYCTQPQIEVLTV